MSTTRYYLREKSWPNTVLSRPWLVHRDRDEEGKYRTWPTLKGARAWTTREAAELAIKVIQPLLDDPNVELEVYEHTPVPKPKRGPSELEKLLRLK